MPDGRLMEEAGVQAVIKGLGTFKSGAKEMDQAIAGIGRAADKAKTPVQRFQQSFADLEKKAKKAIIPLAAVSAVLVATVGKMVMTAARTEELAVVVENMGRVAGYSEAQLSKVEEEIKDLGITTQAARTIMTRFIGAELDLADATKITRAAQDLAVIGMEDSSTAAANLTYAIASMQPRILRQYGIFINLNKVYEETATTLGKQVDELTETEKRQGFLNAVLRQAASYAGTYEAAMGTAGKQLRSFRRYTEEISNELGQHFLPYLGEAVGLATDFAKAILALSDEQKEGVARVLMYAAAMSTAATAMAGAVLMAGKLKAALMFLLTPYALVGAALTFLMVRFVEMRREFQKQATEITETAETAEEYADRMAEARTQVRGLTEDVTAFGVTVRQWNTEEERANDILEWNRKKLTEVALATMELTARTEDRVRVVVRQITEEEILAYQLEHVSDALKGMAKAFYGNIQSIQDGITAYDELEKKVVTVFANTAAATRNFQVATQRAEEDAALRREELLEKHAEKMHWVATGAHARTKKENEEAFAHWAALNAEELAKFDAAVALKQTRRTEDYDHAIATANAAAAERTRIAEEQQAAELEAQRKAQEERLLLLALEMIAAHETLTVMSPWGELEVSVQEYYEAITSGLAPVSEAMKTNLGTAIEFIDGQMTTANKNISEGYSGWQGIIEGIVPDVMELGKTSKEESEAMSGVMERRLSPAIGEVSLRIQESNKEFGIWATDSGVATEEIGQSLEGLEEPMKFVQEKIGETEVYYGEQMTAMQTKTDETFEEIETTIDETLTGVQTAFGDTLTDVHRKLLTFKPKFRRVGRGLVQGLINGILDKQEAASKAMSRLVNKMIEAAEEAAGSSSPSRVFAGIAMDMILGLIQGLDELEPVLIEAITKLSEGMSDAFLDASERVGGFVSLLKSIVGLFDQLSKLDVWTETMWGPMFEGEQFSFAMIEMAESIREVWEATEDWIGGMRGEGLDVLERYVNVLRNMVALYRDLVDVFGYGGMAGLMAELSGIVIPLPSVMGSATPQSVASPVMVQGGHTFNYNLSANYSQVQSPASIMDDLQALEMLAGAKG